MHQTDQHPELRGYFARFQDELKAARGLPSSHDYDFAAKKWDLWAFFLAQTIDEQRQERDFCQQIAADEAQAAELREAAQQWAVYIEREMLPRYEAQRQEKQEHAAQFRKKAEQARRFEARWSFDPYTDPFWDSLELRQREAEKEGARSQGKTSKATRTISNTPRR